MLCLSAPSPLNTNTVGRDHAPGWLSRCQRFPALPGYAPGSSGPSSRGQLQSSAWQAAHRAGRVKVLRGQSHPHAWQSHIGVPLSDTSIVFFSHAHRAALPRHPKVGFSVNCESLYGQPPESVKSRCADSLPGQGLAQPPGTAGSSYAPYSS